MKVRNIPKRIKGYMKIHLGKTIVVHNLNQIWDKMFT